MNAYLHSLRSCRTPRRTPCARLAAHFRHAAGSCLLRQTGIVLYRAEAAETPLRRQPTHPAPGMPV